MINTGFFEYFCFSDYDDYDTTTLFFRIVVGLKPHEYCVFYLLTTMTTIEVYYNIKFFPHTRN